MVSNVCDYCDKLTGVSECLECVFTCGRCHKLTPYANGYAGSDLCDNCFTDTDLKLQIGQALATFKRGAN